MDRRADSHPAPAELHRNGAGWLLDARPDDRQRKASPGIVPALENAIAIIAYVNQKAPRPIGLAEISSNVGVSKSHCHALLKTLTYYDWLEFDGDTKMYRLKSGILTDASSVWNAPITGLCRPHLTALVERVRVPCVISEPMADDSFVVIERFNTPHIMEVVFPVGHRFVRNACAQMRAYLAWQSPERIDRWMQDWSPLAYTDSSLLDAASVRAEIGATRRRGYSRSVGEFTEGLMAMALPIFDRTGRVAYLFHCASLTNVLLPMEQQVAREMQRTAADIHRAIAAKVPPDFPS